ncbi:LPS assembly protein LptD, partial [Vibrio cholerae]|uniref:LPS assembly protein LptD n=1 Tax=Vibrio cholerae TaxID=666 RepID=UPI0018F0E90B
GVGNREDGQLIQEGRATYRSDSCDSALLVRDFQLLTDNPSSSNLPYRLMPQLTYNYYAPEAMYYLDLDHISHISRFET